MLDKPWFFYITSVNKVSISKEKKVRCYEHSKSFISIILFEKSGSMNFKQIIIEARTKSKETIDLQEKLYSLDSNNFQSFHEYILSSRFFENRESLLVLLRCIDRIFNSRPLLSSFYIEIIKSLKNSIETHFTSYELLTDIFQNQFLRYKLFELGLISVSNVKSFIRNLKNDMSLFFTFFFEIKSLDEKFSNSYLHLSPEVRIDMKEITPEEHSFYRDFPLCQEKVACLIRSNDVISLQSLQAATNLNINIKIRSAYEIHLFSMNEMSLIEYAAFFGAVDVFKYLLLNGAVLSENVANCSIAGGHYEIIHILEQNGIKFNTKELLNVAIEYHRNDIVEYIVETLEVDFSHESLVKCLKCYNISVFFEIMNKYVISNKFEDEKSKIIELIVECGHIDIFRAFSVLIDNSDILNKLLNIALLNRRFDVFKEIHTIMNKNNYTIDNKSFFKRLEKLVIKQC